MGKTFKIVVNGRLYSVEVGDLSESPVVVKVDGEVFEVELEREDRGATAPAVAPKPAVQRPVPAPRTIEPLPQQVKGPSGAPATDAGKSITAPMPGTVLAVKVKDGEQIKRGQEVCILESMKMELNIMSTADGVVKKVCVAVGQNVVHGTVLIELD
jgi:biotin carboxyl carrier protein